MPEVITDTSPIQYIYQTNLLDLLPILYGQITMSHTSGEYFGILLGNAHPTKF